VGPGADPICGLPGVPSSMRGLYARRGRALPIVDLSEYMGGRHCREDSPLLIAAEGDDAIGLLIDEDRGMVDSGEWGRSDLPPLIRTRELSAAAVTMDRIAFLLDTAALFGGKRSAAGLSELYAPDSRFSADVMRREIKVIEFQLCGMPHALPSSEVEDVVPYRTVFGVPRASAIVRGAAELGGSILPVLDLAAVYGRRTEVNPAGSIILVKNGDFRALILCEAVFEGRTLGLDSQRRLPVASPYGVVYGCYTAGNGVRLILNTEALAVNFEDVEIVDFFSALPAPVPPSAAAEPPSVKMPTQEPPLAVPAAVRRRLGGPGSARASLGSARASLGSAKASLGSAKASLGGTARIEAQATPIKSTIVEPAISPESPFAETQGIPETTPVSVRASSGGAGRRYRRLLRAAIISILLAAALVALGIVILRGGGRPEEEARPAAQTPQSMESPPLEEDALLELEVPPELPMDVEIYIVQKGDTLWDIALRFTGNPRNYPRIAGENTIPDPDLIEPGQRIRLKRKTP
jgi:chemotaxis signal transduction protein/nucleoid-associated protein YgaU